MYGPLFLKTTTYCVCLRFRRENAVFTHYFDKIHDFEWISFAIAQNCARIEENVSAQMRKGPIYAGLKQLFTAPHDEMRGLEDVDRGLGRMVRAISTWQSVSHKIHQDYNDTLAPT